MSRKVIISNRSVYHKIAKVEVEIPNDVKDIEVEYTQVYGGHL